MTVIYYGLVIAQLAAFAMTLTFADGDAFSEPLTWVFIWVGLVWVFVGASTMAVWIFRNRRRPDKGGFLHHGIYRHVRHPMYTGVVTIGLGFLVVGPTPSGGVAFATLVAATFARAVVEERLLIEKQPEYAEYRDRTKRFLPGII